MAFNQASFFLFPPRFGPVVEYDHAANTMSGKPLEIIGTEVVDPAARIVSTEELRKWFLAHGFSEKERYGGLQILYRGRCATPFGARALIEFGLPLDEDEIQELYIRFLLTEKTPTEIPAWTGLVTELGHDFGFQIMDESHRLLPCIDFVTVLQENRNFQYFRENYRWEL